MASAANESLIGRSGNKEVSQLRKRELFGRQTELEMGMSLSLKPKPRIGSMTRQKR